MPTPYELNLPCLNPNCKSHGQPHPNCRCYGFSEGGEVGHYCSEARPHKNDCEYFADGGMATPDWDSLSTEPPKTDQQAPDWDLLSTTPPGKTDQAPDWDALSTEPPTQSTSGDALEQVKAGAEGIAQGLVGDLAKVVQVKTGISTIEDIEKREKEFPVTHGIAKGAAFAGSLFAGPAKMIAASAGSKLLGNVLAASAYSLSDNTAKAFLGQPGGDVNSVVAGTLIRGGLEGMMNTLTGGLFSAAPKAAKAVLNEKTVKMAENFMIDLAEKPVSKALTYAGARGMGGSGIISDIAEYKVLKEWAKPQIEKVIGKPLTKANNYVGDVILNTLAKTDFLGVPSMIRWAERSSAGLNSVAGPIEALFKSGTHYVADETQEKVVEQIRDWMEQGGIDGELERQQQPEGFASGGKVGQKTRSFETLYPAENIMLNQARARVSGYLNTLRPSKTQSKLPFDSNRSQKQQEKEYGKAIGFAANPLSVMKLVNKGNLTPGDMKHFKSLWPEVHEHLSKKMTERILTAQMNGEKPPYSKRQAMSLFLGADLDSSFTPQSISVVQGMYAAKSVQRQAAPAQGSKKAIAKSSNQYSTPEQSREKRLQNQK